MGLIGHWRRSVLGAGGVALLLPLGLVLGVALTTALGGETTLRALGQVFAGPAAPSAEGAPGLEMASSVPAVPVRRRGDVPGSSGAPGSTAGPGAGAGATPSGPSDPGNPGPTDEPGSTGPVVPPAAGPGPSVPPAAEPAPAPEPGSAAHDAAQAAADAVAAVPVAGALADDAMQTVVDLIP